MERGSNMLIHFRMVAGGPPPAPAHGSISADSRFRSQGVTLVSRSARRERSKLTRARIWVLSCGSFVPRVFHIHSPGAQRGPGRLYMALEALAQTTKFHFFPLRRAGHTGKA